VLDDVVVWVVFVVDDVDVVWNVVVEDNLVVDDVVVWVVFVVDDVVVDDVVV
jgi:hypothetical protein